MVRMHDGELAGRVSIEFAERLLTSGAAQRIGREKLRYVRLVPGIVMARSSSGWDLIEEGDANTAMRRSGAVPKLHGQGMATKTLLLSNGEVGKRLLNAREAAQYLSLEVDTVYKKARLRELPYVKVGRALRFDVKALERFVEQHTIKTID